LPSKDSQYFLVSASPGYRQPCHAGFRPHSTLNKPLAHGRVKRDIRKRVKGMGQESIYAFSTREREGASQRERVRRIVKGKRRERERVSE
jgi:hypothetical protein